MIRYPSWVKEDALKIIINGKPVPYEANPSSYVAVNHRWRTGDVVQVELPMHNSIEQLPNVPEYIAFMHGPILLGAKTGTEDLKGLIADDSRWGHIASGKRLPVDKAPILVEENISGIADDLVPVKNKPLTFRLPELNMINPVNVELEPFYRIHDSRYMIYWMNLTNTQSRIYLDSLAIIEKERMELQNRTIDYVATGEQQPEVDHKLEQVNSNTGNLQDEFWRDARNEGHFSYSMSTDKETDLYLVVRYWGAERGNRKFDIYIDEEKLASENNTGKWNLNSFQEVEYGIPGSMIKGKQFIRVKFQALPGASVSQVFYIRLARKRTQS